MRRSPHCAALLVASISAFFASPSSFAEACTPENTVTAKVVALDQAWAWNRYGALQPHGMMFALRRDVCSIGDKGISCPEPGQEIELKAGHVILRSDKRPRPLVLRVNRGQCLRVEFTNLLDESHRNRFLADRPEHAKCGRGDQGTFADGEGCGDQPGERWAGFHPNGLELEDSPLDDASHVGKNKSSLVPPNGSITYTFLARHEGTFFAYSPASTTGGDGNGGSIFAGLFGAVNVEPEGSIWYRSQVRRDELEAARKKEAATGHPLLDYSRFAILGAENEILHSDLTAIVDTRHSTFESKLAHDCFDNMIQVGKRDPGLCADPKKPFREFTIIFHDESGAVQAFDEFDGISVQGCEDDDPSDDCKVAVIREDILHSARDGFAINYGTAGIGAEVLANRKRLGPVRDCPECLMEEFFLSSWAVGDPAMVVDLPANIQLKFGGRPRGVYFPDDPSNVYHSYLNDRVVFRNLHAGPKEHHVFHLHAHQWLQTQYNPRSAYLDSQTIGPGGTYTYEIAYGGSGNRNRTAGDSIFHCHFYPHFAQGMWSLWRVHDVFEPGTELEADAWQRRHLAVPRKEARALPDGEIRAGTPIPALLPLPGYALAPMPGKVSIVDGQIADLDEKKHPGYPFFIPGKAGHRPPEPPLDTLHDGGLPRHIVDKGEMLADEMVDGNSRSFDKKWLWLKPSYLDEHGTPDELRAMKFHAEESHPTVDSMGNSASFATNGQAPQSGAPYADPCPKNFDRKRVKRFEAAAFELDLIFNKKGWHTPQARILALRDDVDATLGGSRAPQPLFFRVNSGDCIEFRHTNLVPRVWQQDAFQVRTPTDIIGQHIHLVKFDVTSSDGSGNGFNYEDGTTSYQEVQERIDAINEANDCGRWKFWKGKRRCPTAENHPWFGKRFRGGKVTVQRWYADPQLIPTETRQADGGFELDKTLETVFTHDHFGPSTHQQAGLYAGLIVEPEGSRYFDGTTRLGHKRRDGGPTSWKAVVESPSFDENGNSVMLKNREFGILYQDFLIAYRRDGETEGAINAPGQVAVDEPHPDRLVQWKDICAKKPHCPEAVSADDIGVMSINYRSEPAPLRLLGADPQTEKGDLAFLFSSIERADSDLNRHPSSYPLVAGPSPASWPLVSPGMEPFDPFTPLLEVVDGEKFKIRLLAGAHEHEHSFTLNAINWRFMAREPDSGDRSFLTSALSEHHEVDGLLRIPSALNSKIDRWRSFDHLFKVGASVDDTWYGNWGILRAYRKQYRPVYLEDLTGDQGRTPVEMMAKDDAPTFAPRASAMLQTESLEPESRDALVGQYKNLYLDRFLEMDGGMAEDRALSFSPFLAALRATPVVDPLVWYEARVDRLSDAVAEIPAPAASGLGVRSAAAAEGIPVPSAERLAEALEEEERDFEETSRLVKAAIDQVKRGDKAYIAMIPDPPATKDADDLEAMAQSGTPETIEDRLAYLSSLRPFFPKVVDVDDGNPDLNALPVCPYNAPLRAYAVSVIAAKDVLPGGKLVYHRFPAGTGPGDEEWKAVTDPTALIYIRDRYLNPAGNRILDEYKIEPLILRATAGDCIEIHLTNRLPQLQDDELRYDLNGYNTLPNLVQDFNFNQLKVSSEVGIHVQGLRYHPGESDGMNVGRNPQQTIGPQEKRVYRFYAGRIEKKFGEPIHVPVEYGVLNLMPADPIKQNSKGLVGAIVIEPERSFWAHDWVSAEPYTAGGKLISRASATLFTRVGTQWKIFRDLVLVGQNDANFQLEYSRGASVYSRPVRRVAMAPGCGENADPNGNCAEAKVKDEEVDAVDTGHKAFNYRSEAMWMRRGVSAALPLDQTLARDDSHQLLSDRFYEPGSPNQTPRFCVRPGAETRLRVAFPGGHGRNHILQVHGHSFPELPFLEDSTVLGDNGWTFHKGSQDGIGPGSSFNLLLGPAGGENRVEADYLIRDQYSWGFDNGLWAVLDVDGSCSE